MVALHIVTGAVALLLLSQHTSLVRCQTLCDDSYPNPSIDRNVSIMANLLSLLDGLKAQNQILVCECTVHKSSGHSYSCVAKTFLCSDYIFAVWILSANKRYEQCIPQLDEEPGYLE